MAADQARFPGNAALQAAATCILPKHQQGVSYGGREGHHVVFHVLL